MRGASSILGSEIVARLERAGHEVLVLSDGPKESEENLPEAATANHGSWGVVPGGVQVYLHFQTSCDCGTDGLDAKGCPISGMLGDDMSAAEKVGVVRKIQIAPLASRFSRPGEAGHHRIVRGMGLASELVYVGYLHDKNGKLLPNVFGPFRGWLKAIPFPLVAPIVPTTAVDRLITYVSNPVSSSPGQDVFLTDKKAENAVYRVWQVALDMLFVLSVLLLFPMLAIAWLVVRSGGSPGLLRQIRIGYGSQPFRCLKLRTMKIGTPSRGTHLVGSEAITPFGRILRKSKIDELPQAWNVLRREMTLVGPRPSLPEQVDVISFRHQRGVLSLRPGLTGWAQIHGVDMRNAELIAKYDSEYLGLQSVIIDLLILKATIRPSWFEPKAPRVTELGT